MRRTSVEPKQMIESEEVGHNDRYVARWSDVNGIINVSENLNEINMNPNY